MDTFSALHEALHRVLELNDEPRLQPGISREEAMALFKAIGMVPPDALLRCYELHNGIIHLNGFLHFLPLQEAINTHRSYIEISSYEGIPGWSPDAFPVFDLNGDIQICVNFSTHVVTCVDIEDASTSFVADSFEIFVQAILELLRSNAHYYDPESGTVGFYQEQWEEVMRKYHVSLPW